MTPTHLLISIWAYVWCTVITAVMASLYLLGAPVDRRGIWMDFCQRVWSTLLLGLIGVRVGVEGREHVPQGRACVVMANHRSYLDIPVLVQSVQPLGLRFVAKKELTRIPILGWALLLSRHVKVDRGNREQAVSAIRQASENVRSGIALVFFPEGTRSFTDRLLPFKKGGFYVAVDTGFPVLPVSVQNTGRIYGKRQFLLHPGRARVVVHPEVPTAGRSRGDVLGLIEDVRGRILAGLPASQDLEPTVSLPTPVPPDRSRPPLSPGPR